MLDCPAGLSLLAVVCSPFIESLLSLAANDPDGGPATEHTLLRPHKGTTWSRADARASKPRSLAANTADPALVAPR